MQKLSIETLQVLPSDCGSTASRSCNLDGAFLCCSECRLPAAVQQTRVVQTGHDAQQRVEPSHVLRCAACALRTKHGQPYVNNMGKAAASFTARSQNTMLLRYQVTMRDQTRCGSILEGRNSLSGSRNSRNRRFILTLHGSS